MKKHISLKSVFLFAALLCSQVNFAQKQAPFFDREKEKAEAIKKGMNYDDIDGYLFALEREFFDKQNYKPIDANDPYGLYTQAKGGTQGTMGAGCVNASFDLTNFTNWTGSSGNSNTCGPAGAQSPNYTIVNPTIVSPAGANAGLTNALNWHTIVSIPPTNPNYPNCNQFGYDSIAVLAVGANTVSQIPHVCPYYPDGKSVRMNGALANYRACRMRYSFALGPNNRNITYAFALVFYGAHAANQQPYFKVSVLDQNNNPIGGNCGVYNVNGLMAGTDTSFFQSAVGFGQVSCRKWRQYGVDLTSPMYATVTACNLEFTVGGCCYGGHYGYAYVDAECAQGGAFASMCVGTNSAVLTAPAGYVTYQWYLLPGMIPQPPGIGGNTPTLTVNPAIVGQVYQIKMTTPTGCTVSLNDTIKISGIQILNIGTSPTCPGGASGTATVNVTGSNTGYGFLWQNSFGATVSTTNTAVGLAPGVYSVTVSGVSCGPPATATVLVGSSPPTYSSYTKNYCGNLAILTATTGTGYAWYNNLTPIPAAAGSPSLVINNPANNSVYYVTYLTPQGCKDSLKYTLVQIGGGNIDVSNIKEICPTSPPVSYGVVNLNTTQPGPYSYSITGTGYSSILNNTPLKKDSVTGLSIGSYTAIVFDGACYYATTFTVTPYNFNYTVTPTNTVLCMTGVVPMGVSLSNTTIPVCGGNVASPCNSPAVKTLGAGVINNTQFAYPSIYSAYYKNCRHQLLYTAAELTAAGIQPGKISSMEFNISSMLPLGNNTNSYIGNLQGFSIGMKCTNVVSLNTVFDNVGFVNVLAPVNYTPTVGWNKHPFTTTFDWDGVSNILVDVCYNLNFANNMTSSPIMPSTNTGVIKCRYQYNNFTPMCGTALAAFTSLNRPNARLGNCPITKPSDFTYTWTPNYALTTTNTQSTISTPSISTIYSITVNPIGQVNCAQTQTVNINVIIPVTPTITGGPYCTNFAPLPVTVSPTNGTWTPTSYLTTGGVFTPSLATVGANPVVFTNGTGTCTLSNTLTINVEQFNPATLTGNIPPQCMNYPTTALTGLVANTTGIWTGAGITGTTFDPSLSGAGIFILTYNTNSVPTTSLCPDVSTLQVNVFTVQQPTIVPNGPYCNNMAPIQLSVVPSGGVYSGWNTIAVSPSGQFNPGTAVIGQNNIGYTITSGPCVKTTSIVVNVENFVSATLSAALGPYCYNALPTPLSSIVVAMGGVWSGTGINGGNFNPLTSGPGDFLLTYSTFSSPTASLCPDVSTISVHVNPQPLANIVTSTLSICLRHSIDFSNDNLIGTAIWNFGDNSPFVNGFYVTHTYTAPGTYFATLDYSDDIGCRVIKNTPAITIWPLPKADFYATPLYTLSIADPAVQFINTSTVLNTNTYLWNIANFAADDKTNTAFTFTAAGFYYITLTATNQFGCVDTITRLIEVNNEFGFWVPNAFTPNGDGKNDEFRPIASPYGLEMDMATYELDIFDRWGEKIFSTQNFYTGWNGTMFNKGDEIVKNDIYVWKIRFRDAQRKVYNRAGHVTLYK